MDRRKTERAIVLAAGIALGLACLGGCAHGPAVTPMDPNAFVPPADRNRDEPVLTSNQQVGPLTNDNAPAASSPSQIAKADVPPSIGLPEIAPIPRLNSNPAETGDTHPDSTKADQSKTDTATVLAAPAAQPAENARTASEMLPASSVPSTGSGVYMCVGGVVARIGSTPIYTEKVLGVLDKEFRARAHEMSPEEFKGFVRYEIVQELHELTRDEIIFSNADKALSQEEHKLATAYAEKDRQDRVRAHNGSVEVARHEAKEDGTDLDEQCRQDYRHIIVELYNQKQIDPMIKVSADDMRDFYRQNVDKLYSQKERISFRVIEIKPSMMGGDSPDAMALDKIRGIREKAVRGMISASWRRRTTTTRI